MTPEKEFPFNHLLDTAPNMEIRELIIQTALAMEKQESTSQRQSNRERVPKTPKKNRK